MLFAVVTGFPLKPKFWEAIVASAIVTVVVFGINKFSKYCFGETPGKYLSNMFYTLALVVSVSVFTNYYQGIYEHFNPTYKQLYVDPLTNETDTITKQVIDHFRDLYGNNYEPVFTGYGVNQSIPNKRFYEVTHTYRLKEGFFSNKTHRSLLNVDVQQKTVEILSDSILNSEIKLKRE